MPHLNAGGGLSTQYVIEYDGKPIASQLRRAWTGARQMAKLGPEVTPHVLKHTCATLMLQNRVITWDVAGVLGTSEAVIRKTYGHHCVEHLRLRRRCLVASSDQSEGLRREFPRAEKFAARAKLLI